MSRTSVDAGAVSVGHKGVIFVETMYDSPLSPATVGQKGGPAETHRGEYLVLWNTTADSVPLEDYSLKNLSNSDTVDFSGDTLAPFQWMLVGHADSVADLQLVTALPWSVLNDSAVTVKLVDDFRMEDTKGQLRLKYTSSGELIDAADYGSVSGLEASNAFVSEEDLDSLGGRDALKGIIRIGLNKPGYGFDPSNFDTKDIEVKVEPVFEQDWFTKAFEREPGCKQYELKNHLGNVLAVVSDWKIGRDTVGNGAADYYLADIRSLSDYYPFGMEMAARSWNADGYRYRFQGQETDDEVNGSGNSVFFKYRVHDPRVGRFLSVDPLTADYPHYTPYSFSGNKVVAFRELEGLEERQANVTWDDPGIKGAMARGVSDHEVKENYQKPMRVPGLIVDAGLVVIAGGALAGPAIVSWVTANPLTAMYVFKEGGDFTAGLLDPVPGIQEVDPSSSFDEGGQIVGDGIRSLGKVLDDKIDDLAFFTKTGTAGGTRAGKKFTPKGKKEVIDLNKSVNNGLVKCEACKVETVPAQKSMKGVTPPRNETQVDHIIPKSKGGDGSPSNGQVLCRDCNRKKSDKYE